jgi:filamentous hemagglutinin family protein
MNSGHHKTIFSKRLGCLVAVGEHASSQGKANGAASGQFSGFSGTDWLSTVLQFVGVLTASCAMVSLAWAGPAATALPTGGQVAQGAVSVQQAGAVMSINQSTSKAVVNWNTFDIGQNAKVNIVQPGPNAVMLNRVTSANPSQILGQLNANGQVVLVNPNGVLFGKDGSVNASSFTASTLGISDANFMAGNLQFERNGSTASVVNQGSISTTGGYVALLGASVSNEGKINTQGGTAYLAAAETVKIPVSGSGRIKLELSPSRINAAVANGKGGTIVTEGGQVYMQAASLSNMVASIIQSGNIDTTGAQGGAVHLLADGGQIRVDGSITANSTGSDGQGQQNTGGDIIIGRDMVTEVLAKATDASGATLESNSGFVETSAEYLSTAGIKVAAGTWLLDPNNIEINATSTAVTAGNSVVKAGDIAAALTAGTTVTVTTGTGAGSTSSASGVSQATAGTGSASAGTIAVNSAINSNYTGANNPTLTLSAASNIAVNAAITTAGSNIVLKSSGGSISNSAVITGRNVSIDNTGGMIDSATGAITKGLIAGPSATGISVGANITASANLNMYGLSVNGTGLAVAAGKNLSGGNIQATGQTGSIYGVKLEDNVKVFTTGTSGNSLLKGIGESSGGGGQAALQMVTTTFDAATGTTLTVEGRATAVAPDTNTNTRGIRIDGAIDTYGDITMTGFSGSNDGFLLQSGQINVRQGSLKINGTIAANGGGWRSGANIDKPIYLYNGTTLSVVGVAANQTSAMTAGRPEVGLALGGAIAPAAGQTAGNVSLIGYTSSYENSMGVVLNGNVTTAGNINVVGQSLGGSAGNSVTLNSVISSTAGDVTIQSVGGKIGQAGAKTISAKNITIDNTGAGLSSFIADTTAGLSLSVGTVMGGSINSSTGAITVGSGLDLYYTGVTLSGSSTATGNINIAGVSATTTEALGGVKVAGNLTANSGAVNIYAKDTSGGQNYAFYQSTGTIKSGTGGVNINVLGSGSNSALGLYGTTTSTGAVSLTGDAGTGSGNGIWTSGTVGITGASVNINGTGGTTGGNGVNLSPGATVIANGSGGAVNITGNAGSGATSGVGIVTASPTTGTVTITGPSVSLTGTGGANGGSGLSLASGTTITGNNSSGSVVLSGTAKKNGMSGIVSNASIVGASNVSLTGNFTGANSAALVNITSGSITGASGKAINLTGGTFGGANIITNGAAVKFSNATLLNNLYSGVISNGTGTRTGSVENISGGQTFTGTNTYSGTTTVTEGTLQLGNNGTTGVVGTGDVTLGSAGTLVFNRSNDFTFSNKILGQTTGNGAVIKNGTKNVTLAGANTYGTTQINTGVLSTYGNASAFGTGLVTVASGAQAYIHDTTVANDFNIAGGGIIYSGTNTGAIRLQQNAATTTGVSGKITLNGAATIGAQLYSSGDNVSGGVFTLGAIDGTGPLTYQSIFNQQTFSVSGKGNYSGDTIVLRSLYEDGSTLKFTGEGTPGASSGKIDLASAGVIVEFAGDSLTVGNQITGAGKIVQSSSNTTKLTANNTYTGSTTVSGGTLQVGDGGTTGTLGAGAVALSNNANLAFVRSVDTSITNAITGNGNVSANITTNGSTPGALTVNSSNFNVGGTIDLRADGDVNLVNSITTSNNTGDAVKLVAGQAYGVEGGVGAINTSLGNVKVTSGKTITMDSGGVAILYSGSIAGTTGVGTLGSMAESGSGKFRYNSDETKANYTKSLDQKSGTNNGVNIIYREAPEITVTAKSTPTSTLTYNGSIQNDPNAGYTSDLLTPAKNGDTLSFTGRALYAYTKGSGATLETDLKNAGTYTKTVMGLTNNLGYKVTTVNGSLEIDRAALTVTAQQVTKTYDGTLNASGPGLVGTLAGSNAGESVNSAGSQAFTDKNFGVGNKIVRASGVTIKDSSNVDVTSNYNITYVDNTTSTINKLAISAAIDAVTTTYGTNAATGGVSLIGVINGDSVSPGGSSLEGSVLSTSGRLKAGTYVQSVDGSLSGADAGNYTFSGISSANYVVTKLALNTQIAGVTTTYGTAAATGAASVSGVLSGDKVDLGNAKATLVNAVNSSSGNLKVGTYQQTVANSLSGDDAANYTAAPTSLANYVVTPKAIAATVTAADKVYDGNNVATLNANSAGILTGDVVNVLGATGTFASKNVARDGVGNVVTQTVTVTGTGVGLGGTDGANYTLTNATSIASTTARITPKDLSVSGITAIDKVYDGSTAAVINSANAVLAGVVTGDSVSVSTQSGVGNFASKDVAFDGAGVVTSQAVTVSGLTLNGADAINYNVSDKSGASAKVLQRALNITGSVAQDKTVDGNTNAQVTPGQLGNLVAGESLVVSATGQFADAEIGTNKAVTTQYALANGANGVARNYTLAGEVLRAAILVAAINPVQSIVNPAKTGGGSRVAVSGSGNSGAALGVAEGTVEEEIISREECSVLNPEKCQCQESTIAGVEMCFAPVQAANSKN